MRPRRPKKRPPPPSNSDSFSVEKQASEEESPGCNEIPAPPALELVAPAGLHQLESGEEALEVEFINRRGVSADVTISLSSVSRTGTWQTSVERPISSAGEGSFLITRAELPVTSDALNFSGELLINATAIFADGDKSTTHLLVLFYHPEGEDLLVYDLATRNASFDRGALNLQARTQLQDLQSELEREDIDIAETPAVKLSDSPYFVPDERDSIPFDAFPASP